MKSKGRKLSQRELQSLILAEEADDLSAIAAIVDAWISGKITSTMAISQIRKVLEV